MRGRMRSCSVVQWFQAKTDQKTETNLTPRIRVLLET